MSGDPKILDQNPVPATQAPAPQAVGVGSKETGRVAPVSEFVKPSGPETVLDIPAEVSGHVGINSDKPSLTPEHKELGVVHSGPDASIQPASTDLAQIPQGTDVGNSGTWLNALTEKVQKVMSLMGF